MARVSWPHLQSTTAAGETGMVVAAAYLRKSNAEGQTAAELKSTSQQLDEIRKFAASRGWTLDERYVYRDDEVSGEEWVKRPGYQALRAALTPKPPFKVLVVWERSRLGRDAIRQLTFINDLGEAGVEVWSVAENKMLRANDIATMVGAWKDEQDNEDTRGRVIRALNTRFEKGLVSGGACTATPTNESPASTRLCGA